MNKNESVSRYGPLIGAIDEGTNSVRFLVMYFSNNCFHFIKIIKSSITGMIVLISIFLFKNMYIFIDCHGDLGMIHCFLSSSVNY